MEQVDSSDCVCIYHTVYTKQGLFAFYIIFLVYF